MTRTKLALVALLAVTAVVASITVHAAGPCLMSNGTFGGTQYSGAWSTSVHSGNPTGVCPSGDTVYDFQVSVSGNDGSSGSQTFFVCSSLSTPVTLYDSAGTAHTFAPRRGLTWGQVHSSSTCKVVTWTL